MMEHPEALWLLLLVPLLWPLWGWQQRSRPSLRHPDLRLIPTVQQRRVIWAQRVPIWGIALTAFMTILALANPRWPHPGSRIPTEGIALMIALDISGSMAERDVQYLGDTVTRLQAAQAVLNQFIAGGPGFSSRSNDAIGLVTFALKPIDVCPPTLSHSSVRYFLDNAKPISKVPYSATNIGDALAVAIDLLRRYPPPSSYDGEGPGVRGKSGAAILLISDGEHNVPKEIDPDALKPRQAAQLAAALGIRIHTIFLPGATPTKPSDLASRQQAEAALRDVAAMTQGIASTADDGQALSQISQRLDALEKSRLESFFYTEYAEGAPWLIAAALACLLGTIVLEETWLRVSP
jgi:Ca-activated chloride channel family protein